MASVGSLEADESEGDDYLAEVIMAVDMRDRGTVGCSYYVAREAVLYLMEDMKYGGLEVIESLKLQIQPTTSLIPTRVDESIDACLDPEGHPRNSVPPENNMSNLQHVLDVRPTNEFNYETAKNKMTGLKFRSDERSRVLFLTTEDTATGDFGDDSTAGNQGRRLQLAAWVNLESHLSVGCAGAILTYIQRRRSVDGFHADDPAGRVWGVQSLEMFSIANTMFLNMDTVTSLQILNTEFHPQFHNQGPTNATAGSKEGLSIYGIFCQFAGTPQGKALLRQRVLRPSLDKTVINERLDTIAVFLRPDNYASIDMISKSLRKVKNMRTIMLQLQKGASGASATGGIKRGAWANLSQFAFQALKIQESFRDLAGSEMLVIANRIHQSFDQRQLHRAGQLITEAIDFEQSSEQHRTVVKAGFNEDLDSMRYTYDGMDAMLSKVAQDIAQKLPSHLRLALNVIYFPQLGFFIVVPKEQSTNRGVYEGDQSDDDAWEQTFTSDDLAYYKNRDMRQLDDYFGDMYSLICDAEIEIIHALAQQILQIQDLFVDCSDICGELDFLLALARGAAVHNFNKPQITDDNIVMIKGGRHPLYEHTSQSYVANDARLVGGRTRHEMARTDTNVNANTVSSDINPELHEHLEGPSMLIMTGPNYSGKSVYLKQIALIVYLAHVGSFVPADNALIGLTDKILTRVATRETVSRIQSAFMIDLQQVAMAIKLATRRSLLVIDEFGKGTDSSDGAGLACGILEYFLNLGEERPKVLAATHFHEIFEHGFLQPNPNVAFGYLEVDIDPERQGTEDGITYLYNFRSGRSTKSYGVWCAAMNGMSKPIIDRAEQLVQLSIRGEDLVAACSELSEVEKRDLDEAEKIARRFLNHELLDPNSVIESVGSDSSERLLQTILGDTSSI